MPPSPSRARASAAGCSYRDNWCLQLSIRGMAQSAPSAWTAPPVSKSALGRWARKSEIGVSVVGAGAKGRPGQGQEPSDRALAAWCLAIKTNTGRCRQQALRRRPCGRLGLGVSPYTPGFWKEFSAPRERFFIQNGAIGSLQGAAVVLECWSPGTGAPCRVGTLSSGEDMACRPGSAGGVEKLLLGWGAAFSVGAM